MNGSTHRAIALATTLTAFSGVSDMQYPLLIGVTMYAATFPDVDLVDNQNGSTPEIVAETLLRALPPIALSIWYTNHIGLFSLWFAWVALMVWQPHRGFTHTIYGMVCTSLMIFFMTDNNIAAWFIASYGTHLAADCLNKTRVPIFGGKGFCLGWIKTGSVEERIIFVITTALYILLIDARYDAFSFVKEVFTR